MSQNLPLVVQVVPAFEMGGAEWMAAHLAVHLPINQFNRCAISLYSASHSPIEAYLEHHGVPIHYLNKRRGLDPSLWVHLYRLFRSLRPDIVHTHLTVGRYVYPACWAARYCRIVHTVHNIATVELSGLWRRFQGWAYRFGVQPVSIAGEVTRTFVQEYGRAPAAEIPNAIPTQLYAPDPVRRLEWRTRNEVHERALVYVCVAGLRPQKNHSLLIQAFALVAKRLPDALLLLVGGVDQLNPQHAEVLKRQAQQLGISHRVRFLGARGDVPDVLRASDVFVLSSNYEGNPLAVLEAMASGVPVISTAVGGVPEVVADGISGLLVPAGNLEALSEAMVQLGCDVSRRTRMGRAARQTALERFDVQVMSRAYTEFYLQLLGS